MAERLPSGWRLVAVEWIDVEQSWSVGAARYIGKSKDRVWTHHVRVQARNMLDAALDAMADLAEGCAGYEARKPWEKAA